MSTSQLSTSQVTINDVGTAEDFLAAIEGTIKNFNDGDLVSGIVVQVDREEVLLDIGYKTEGVIPARELSIRNDLDPSEIVKVGERVEALVLTKEDKEGRLILSKKRAQYEKAWVDIEEKKNRDEVVVGTVIEVVKGGLIVDIGLRGFLPASLVELRRVRDLTPYIGKQVETRIIELDKNRNNVVLSRRAYLEQTQSESRTSFLNQLQRGQVRTGVVSSIVNFGAFVDLGGVDGLVHVSELSWKHIDHPGEVVAVGDEVTVEVLEVDFERERVSLSLKATQEDPWQAFARTHTINQVVPGEVTKLVPFGAFIRVFDGIEGLVHISELAERHVEIPEQVVQVGDQLFVKIIDIDLERRRISLSLKQANEGHDVEIEAFDPSQYGMQARYDESGNFIYPEGFDPETQEWRPGYESQREEWERQYAEAQARFVAHKKQKAEAKAADAAAAEAGVVVATAEGATE
ncbi:MAG: 30S ribosomal protein S1 [Candidatus Nanopelagicaceae bacterium]